MFEIKENAFLVYFQWLDATLKNGKIWNRLETDL
jgi:hypothetical protein